MLLKLILFFLFSATSTFSASHSSHRAHTPHKRAGAPVNGWTPVVFSTETLTLVNQRLSESSNHSWEIGTQQTALLELNSPDLFLYCSSSIPPILSANSTGSDVFKSVDDVIAQKPKGILPFFTDQQAGDPASVGIPVLIRNWTLPVGSTTKYSSDVQGQLNYLISEVPRTNDGAISQRAPSHPLQLWADNLSMVPPFIAYYGALHRNKSLVDEGFKQIKTYRGHLLDQSGLFEHIVFGSQSTRDSGHWATGNAWAVNGMIRVLRTIQLSPFASTMVSEQQSLIEWSTTLLTNVWKLQQTDGSILNYLDKPIAQTFRDSSATALFSACTYRLAVILKDRPEFTALNITAAENARRFVHGDVGSDGWLQHVVDPLNWRQAGSRSPEAQAFVLMLHASYRDWWNEARGIRD